MLKSLQKYARSFLKIQFLPEKRLMMQDILRYGLNGKVFSEAVTAPATTRQTSLEKAVNWLLVAQKATIDHGFASYHLADGWSSSYPETTGYIIPTLIEYGQKSGNQHAIGSAIKAADFLVGIQKGSGGWQGGRIKENKPEIVFNTGQVIRGMISAYGQSGNMKYLDAAIKAGNWLVAIQHPEGYWKKFALMEQQRVYDTFVDVPLIRLSEITGMDIFKDAAVRNLDWVVNSKMLPNGWFQDCDNTIKNNDKPVLHTIAYTLDGLIDSSLMLRDGSYLESAAIGSSQLCELFLSEGKLHGRYNRDWIGSEYFICTGGAQMAIIWLKLFKAGKGAAYLEAARKMINLLIYIQDRFKGERHLTFGAIPGSFPIWGRYEPFNFPNWAAKFYCDALMLEENIKK